MDKLRAMAERLTSAKHLPFGLEIEGDVIHATLGASNRRQSVRLGRDGDDYVLSSVVIGEVKLRSKARRQLLLRIWSQNNVSELVSFGIDSRRRLIGQCRHPVAHLDPQELQLYILALARECDRLEWVLTGDDRF